MNYFLLRFTPTATKRLSHARACAVGSAQQSCLSRLSPRRCREIEEEIGLLPKITPASGTRATSLLPAWRNWKLYSKSSIICLFKMLFSSSRQWDKEGNKILEEYSCGDVLFQGSSFISQVIPLTWCCRHSWRRSVWGCNCWEATFAELNWCDTASMFSYPGTMSG